MTKIVRKIRSTDYWRIGEHESWFSDMSLQGLHLYKMGTHLAHFKKGEPKRMEYRIEVKREKLISDEQIELYKESGWDYVTSYQYFHVFVSPQERHALEIHTDLAEQSFTLEKLYKKAVTNVIVTLIGFVLIIGMLTAALFLDGTPFLRLVEGHLLSQCMLTIIVFYNMYPHLRAMLAIRALKRELIEGKVIDHHAPWQKNLRINTIISVVFFVFACFSVLLPFIQLMKMDTVTLPESDSLLIVRLADIEQNPKLVRDEYYIDGVDWSNSYSTNWSLFAPVQYETEENGVIEDMKWLDESGIYSPRIYSEVYHLTFKALANPLISDLMKWYAFDEDLQYEEIEHRDFDRLMIHEEAEMKKIFASKGNIVMYVWYHGYAELDVIIENMAQKIRSHSAN